MNHKDKYFSRSQCCALTALFKIISGPLPFFENNKKLNLSLVNEDRKQLWLLLDEELKVRARNVIELNYSFTKPTKTEDPGIQTREAVFRLKLESKIRITDIPVAIPLTVEITITMKMLMDVPEWSVDTIQLMASKPETVALIGGDVHEFAVLMEPV